MIRLRIISRKIISFIKFLNLIKSEDYINDYLRKIMIVYKLNNYIITNIIISLVIVYTNIYKM